MSKIYDELRRAEQFRHGSSVVAGLRIKGQILGNEDLVVDGTVDGPIQLGEGRLRVGLEGKVAGNVVAREVVVEGSLIGSLQAGDRVEIKPSGSVVGNVVSGRFVINDGAHYKGSIEIGAKKHMAAAH